MGELSQYMDEPNGVQQMVVIVAANLGSLNNEDFVLWAQSMGVEADTDRDVSKRRRLSAFLVRVSNACSEHKVYRDKMREIALWFSANPERHRRIRDVRQQALTDARNS